MYSNITRYGSSKNSIQDSASVIRARALALGINVKSASNEDLLASAIALDAWVFLTSQIFTDISIKDMDSALASIISRAAGYPQKIIQIKPRSPENLELFKISEEYAYWASNFEGIYPPEILSKVSSDLARGGSLFLDLAYIIDTLKINIL